MSMGEMDAYKDVFLAESADYIQQVTDGLLALEREPLDLAPVEVVFRGIHSLKGMSAAMGYLRTADLTHAMEELMSRVRAGDARVDEELISLLLAAVDLVAALVDDEASGIVGADPHEMISLLGIRMALETAHGAIQGDEAPATAPQPTDGASRADTDQAGSQSVPAADGAPAVPNLARSGSLPRHADAQTVRVDIEHLDTLVDLVGEVIILRSLFDRLVQGREEDLALAEAVSDLHRITRELQYEVLRTRMVPVRNTFKRFPRMVRDLAVELDKQVDFEMTGLDIELDRTLLDEIGDSIVHLLRNAVDHGIETVEQRLAAGKPALGSVRLSAARERDHIAIALADDGRGVNPERVWHEACGRGLTRPQDRATYADNDILTLICVPGFSTADSATRVSGRGVGLDAVKAHVEGLGGTLQISNKPGEGVEFLLRLPLSLAMVKALLVESRGQAFALPLSAVTEVFAIEDLRIETLGVAPFVVQEDGAVIPVVRLETLLFGVDGNTMPSRGSNVVLVTSAGERTALVVDRLLGRQEIVVKPLGPMLSQTQGYSGATVLVDGRVMLILDPRTLIPHLGAS